MDKQEIILKIIFYCFLLILPMGGIWFFCKSYKILKKGWKKESKKLLSEGILFLLAAGSSVFFTFKLLLFIL